MNVTQEDLHSAVWARLMKDMEVRLSELRRLNDGAAIDQIQTTLIRGQIKEVKRILSLSASESPEVGPV